MKKNIPCLVGRDSDDALVGVAFAIAIAIIVIMVVVAIVIYGGAIIGGGSTQNHGWCRASRAEIRFPGS